MLWLIDDSFLGENTVILTITDEYGTTDSCQATVNVTNEPPVAVCKASPVTVPVVKNCQAPGSNTTIIDNGSRDIEDDTPTIVQDKTGPFDLGAHW